MSSKPWLIRHMVSISIKSWLSIIAAAESKEKCIEIYRRDSYSNSITSKCHRIGNKRV
jgi:hypothetical protein